MKRARFVLVGFFSAATRTVNILRSGRVSHTKRKFMLGGTFTAFPPEKSLLAPAPFLEPLSFSPLDPSHPILIASRSYQKPICSFYTIKVERKTCNRPKKNQTNVLNMKQSVLMSWLNKLALEKHRLVVVKGVTCGRIFFLIILFN